MDILYNRAEGECTITDAGEIIARFLCGIRSYEVLRDIINTNQELQEDLKQAHVCLTEAYRKASGLSQFLETNPNLSIRSKIPAGATAPALQLADAYDNHEPWETVGGD